MRKMPIEIVTPERKVYENEVNMVIARGAEGDLGILAGHVPLVTSLKVGKIRLQTDAGEDVIAITGGFLEVKPEKVTILAEAAELPEEIDVDRATRAKERAERRLAESKGDINIERAQESLERALNRLKISMLKKR